MVFMTDLIMIAYAKAESLCFVTPDFKIPFYEEAFYSALLALLRFLKQLKDMES